MGHIDHGKTTLLDAIRKTAVAAGEAGGITQSIGAYQVEHHGKRITFIDTPGHVAFSAMRSRGTRVADIAVLVVAADEGVKPQTEEALGIIRDAELPFVVAVNKIDKPDADPRRVKVELAERGVAVEGFGGTVPVAELSAKTGEGIEGLLETVLLLAELEELESDPSQSGTGIVIESHLDPKRGASATLLLEDGSIARGEFVVVGDQAAPVRIFENFRGETIERAGPSDPVRVVGFASVVPLGEQFTVARTRVDAEVLRAGAAPRSHETPAAKGSREGAHVVTIVLKADVLGSREALETALGDIGSDRLLNRIIKSEVGDISESDVKLASASASTFIVGFRVKIPPTIKDLADRNGVVIVTSDVIYELLDAVKATMVALAPREVRRVERGKAKILALFRGERGKQIVGGRVEEGTIRKGWRFDIIRNNARIGSGAVLELQSQRRTVEEAASGQEFGILADADLTIAAGDGLAVFTEEAEVPQL